MFEKEFEFFRNRAAVFKERVRETIYPEYYPLNCRFAVSTEPVSFADRLNLDYRSISPGEKWGESWDSAWFHITGTVPESCAGREIALLFNAGGEALIFDSDGVPLHGLTGNSHFADKYTKERFLLKGKNAGDKIDIWIEAAANDLLGLVFGPVFGQTIISKEHPQGQFIGLLDRCTLAVFDREAWHLHLDLEVLTSLIDGLPEQDFRRGRWCKVLSKAADVYNENPANTAAAREVLKEIFDIAPSGAMMTVHGVGHAHIDTGWLWPVRETIRKCARTYSSQLALMEEYPEYVFGASAAQHYAFTKKHYPELYAKIKVAVKSGRWEIQGGMWVEADSNIISGESMVRQFVHGKNFFMDEFGIEVKNLWIPDVFGYSAALPQIIRKSGCDYFLTQKLSWNQFNRFPCQTFRWQGIDGSEVITHFPPENTYNSMVMPKEMMNAQNVYLQSDTLSDFMSLYGIGDGGGGPFTELIERGRRIAALDGCPRFKFDRADSFFRTIEPQRNALPVWKGELYFELHRGTLTTQSRTKRGNRKCEQLLALTEFVSSLLPAEKYPSAELDRLWKLLLLNQFHDILPGASIDLVYKQTEKEYAEILDSCNLLLDKAAEALFSPEENSAVAVNSLSYDYDTLVELPRSWQGHNVTDASGNPLAVQQEAEKSFALVHLPKSSFVCLKKGEKTAPQEIKTDDTLILENELVRYVFNSGAQLVEAVDKENKRSLLKPGMCGNDLSLYVDNPANWDAWDIDVYYRNQTPVRPQGIKSRKVVEGNLRSVLEFELKISENSSMRQTVVLEKGKKRLDFHSEVDWHEKHRMLRTGFPLEIFADEASFDIQYGYVKRSMRENTSREMAQFEVCGQRYADVSGLNYGAALLNDCKYGYRAKESVIDLTLLRSPVYPDSTADRGKHEFTYSFLPHNGDLVHSCVMSEAALLNRPPKVFEGMSAHMQFPVTAEADSVTLEVVKMAEKSGCTVIRMAENKGCHANAVLNLHSGCTGLTETDLLEWHDLQQYSVKDGRAEIAFKPFEIKTFKLTDK